MYPKVAYSVAIQYEDAKGKTKNEFIGINLTERQLFESNPKEYFKVLGIENIKGAIKLPKYTLIELSDGRRRMTSSEKELQKGNQLVLKEEWVNIIYHLGQAANIEKSESRLYCEENMNKIEGMFSEIFLFIDKNIKMPKVLSDLRSIYEKADNKRIADYIEAVNGLLKFCRVGAFPKFRYFSKEIGQKRYQSLTECWNGQVIYQSITGLYETRVKLEDLSSWDGAQL